MNLTPLDIRKQEFDNSLWGYSPDEVEAFLDMAATQWEEMKEEHRRLENKVQELQQQMEHYKKVEEALQEALEQTRRNAEERLENAEQEAKTIVREAKADAQEITQQAKAERDRLEEEVDSLATRRKKVAARLRAFLQSELEILDEFRNEGRTVEGESEAAETKEEQELSSLRTPDQPETPSGPDEAAFEGGAPDAGTEHADDARSAEDEWGQQAEKNERAAEELEGTPGGEEPEEGGDPVSPSSPEPEPMNRREDAVASDSSEDDEERPQDPSTGGRAESEEQVDLASAFDLPDDETDSAADPSGAASGETTGRDVSEVRSAPDAGDAGDEHPEDEREREEEEKQEPRGKDDTASSEEIEKIWRILEDME